MTVAKAQPNYIFVNPNTSQEVEQLLKEILLQKLLSPEGTHLRA